MTQRKTRKKPTVLADGVAQPKRQRSPLAVGAGTLLILVSAVGGKLLWDNTTTTAKVVLVSKTLEKGQVLTKEHLAVVDSSLDHRIPSLTAAEAKKFLGKRASLKVPEGSLLISKHFGGGEVPSAGNALVGVELNAKSAPFTLLETGNPVRLVWKDTGKKTGANATTSPVEANPAPAPATGLNQTVEVPGVARAVERGVNAAALVVTVEVSKNDAAAIAVAAAEGKVALVVDDTDMEQTP